MKIRRGPDPGPFYYRVYKPYLQPLFHKRCAYCRTPDRRLGGLQGMTVDHFQPRDRYEHLLNTWTNLYYCCNVCNCCYKRNRPTLEEEQAGRAFVDPCSHDPARHFQLRCDRDRGYRCTVKPRSARARFTLSVLRFNHREFLLDFWQERTSDAAKARRDVRTARRLLRCARRQLRRDPADPDLQEMVEGFRTDLRKAKATLREALDELPFPLDA